jgi:hypothetical protein
LTIQQANAGGIEFFNFQFAGDAAAAHDENAVGQRAHFFQFDRHQQDGHAGVAQRSQLAVDALDGADVDAAGGLAHQHQGRLRQHFARDHHLLLVAAREQADMQVVVVGADVEILHQRRAARRDGLEGEQAPAAFEFVLVAEDGVVHDREILDHAVAQAVFRNVGDAQVADGARQAVGVRAAGERQRLALEVHLARRRQAHAGQDLHQFALTIAGHAGNRDDLAGAQHEADIGQQLDALAVLQLQVLYVQHRHTRVVGTAGQGVDDLAAHHHVGQVFLGGAGGRHGADYAAAAHHGDGVGDVEDFLQIVGDQDDGLALFLEQPQDFEQRRGFLRGEHGGRLVEDQDVGAAVDLLENLHALLGAHRQVVDHGQRIDVEPVAGADLAQLRFHGGALGLELETAFAAQHDVIEHGHVLDQHEVLVHHADAHLDCFLAGADLARLAIEQDLPAVGAVVSVQDAHQGRFAGAVLAHQAVDRTLGDGEVDVRVRLDSPKVLGDAAKLYCRLHERPT